MSPRTEMSRGPEAAGRWQKPNRERSRREREIRGERPPSMEEGEEPEAGREDETNFVNLDESSKFKAANEAIRDMLDWEDAGIKDVIKTGEVTDETDFDLAEAIRLYGQEAGVKDEGMAARLMLQEAYNEAVLNLDSLLASGDVSQEDKDKLYEIRAEVSALNPEPKKKQEPDEAGGRRTGTRTARGGRGKRQIRAA